MVTLTVSTDWYISADGGIDFSALFYGSRYTPSSTSFRVDYETGWFDQFQGTGFRYDADGVIVGGTV